MEQEMVTASLEVTITRKEYDSLLEAAQWLSCLEAAGVDNWDGWDCAVDIRNEMNNELED